MARAYETRLVFFAGDPLRSRFATPAASRRPEAAPRERLEAEVDALDPSVCRRVVFEGAHPTEHPAFEAVVARCKDRGLTGLTLETDAPSLAEPGALERWRALGIERLFVVLGGVRRRVHEHVMQSPGSWEAAMRGLAALATSDLAAYVVLPVLRSNRDDALPLLEYLLALPKRPRGFLLEVPEHRTTPRALWPALLSHDEVATLAARVFRECQRNRVEYGFGSPRAVAPCASQGKLDDFGTVFYERIKLLRRQQGETFVRVDGCAQCSLAEACPGMEQAYTEAHGTTGYAAVPLEVSMDWKLRPLNKLDKREYKNVSDFDNESGGPARSLLRINGHCNMACSFCFVDRTAPDFEFAQLCADIDKLTEHNKEHLVLSGGEPTLHPRLRDLVAYARTRGVQTLEMQSNGVRCSDLEYTRALVEAGLNKVTISLHSAQPEHSDKITLLPGAFPRTVQALHHFRDLGVETQIAHVITKANYKELPDTVRFLQREFPASERHLSVCFAIAQGISDLVYSWVIPRFSEIKPYFREALDLAEGSDIGFGGMLGQGGYPPCMLDGELRYYARVLDKVYRSPEHASQFYKAERCRECSFDPYCVGVRRAYIECYGDAELQPFTADVRAAASSAGVPLAELDPAAVAALVNAPPAQGLVQLRRSRDAQR